MLDSLISLGWGTFSLAREKAEKMVFDTKGRYRQKMHGRPLKSLSKEGKKKSKFKEYLNSGFLRCLKKQPATKTELHELNERVAFLEESLKKQRK